MSLLVQDLFDLKQTEHSLLFKDCRYPWEILPKIKNYLEKYLQPKILGKVSPQAVIEGAVFIGEETVVEPHAYIKGPAWIGKGSQIRQGAYLRGNVIVGNQCVLGNSCEFKNSLFFNEAKAPHFDYVGDSILGYHTHLGAGVTLSNLKVTPGNIVITVKGKKIDTGLRKLGAILGNYVEIGCHAVLNPGSIIGQNSTLYPGISWRGTCPPNSIVKLKQAHTTIKKKSDS